MTTLAVVSSHQNPPIPRADDAEKAVVGAILLQKDGFQAAQDCVRGDFFHALRYRYVYEAQEALAARGAPTTDILLLKAELVARNKLADVGGDAGLAALTDGLPRATNIPHYAAIVREKAMLRAVSAWSTKLADAAASEQGSAEELLGEARRQLGEFEADGPGERALLTGEALSTPLIQRIAEAKSAGRSIRGLSSGYYDIDFATKGFKPGQLLIVAGRPSMGKTSLAGGMAWHASTHGKVVFFASVEMPTEDVSLRLACLDAHVDYQAADDGQVNDDQMARLVRSIGKLEQSTIFINDDARTVADIRRLSRATANKAGRLDLVVIDYLTMLRPSPLLGKKAWGDNRSREVGEMSRELKALAKEMRVPVLLLAQLNRSPEGRQDKRPQLSDLRDSGEIEQDADLVAFVYLHPKYDLESPQNVGEFIIAKQRNGPTGVVHLAWDGPTMSYGNLDRRG
jgi:replicative DNA helicase